MTDIRALYQEVIIDHGRRPRNFGQLESPTHQKEGFNPLCGDKVTVYCDVDKDVVQDIKFDGCGCAISTASASIMTQMVKGKTQAEIQTLFDAFHDALLKPGEPDLDRLGKLGVLVGVKDYPSRVKCAILVWYTVLAALAGNKEEVTTE